ncbi:YfeC-like transcriptional regulator, partial [Klebsiella pneumoniae]
GEAPALSGDAPLEVLLVTLAKEMTPVEQKQFTSLLLREGIIGLLQRLGIRDSK